MLFSVFALAAAAAAQSVAPQTGVKWVPLQSQQAPTSVAQPTAAPATSAQMQVMPAVATRGTPEGRFLPAGTMVSLTPIDELNSKHVKQGEHYKFLVVSDVTEGGVVVIPRGSNALGVVSMQTGRAIGGKSGKFDVSFESVTANGVTFPLSGVHRQEGKGNTVGALLGSILISGRSAVMLPGEVVTAMIRERTAY